MTFTARRASGRLARLIGPLAILVGAGSLTLALPSLAAPIDPPRVGAAVVPAYPCSVGTRAFSTHTVPFEIPFGRVSKVVTVSGMGNSLRDLDLETFIEHPKVGQLTITLTSPAGVEITIVKERGGLTANAYRGTQWDDQADDPVSDHTFATGLAPHLSPEQALARFRGTNPNGEWTIAVADSVDDGTIAGWNG